MCLVAFQKMFQKIFSDVWLCSWKYHRKHIFYLLLTFSRLPNKYKISFIPQNTNKTQKKIIKSGHFARSRSTRRRDCNRHGWCFTRSWSTLCAIAIVASYDHDQRGRCFVRSRSTLRVIAIGAVPVMSADDIGELGFGQSLLSLLSFSLSFFCAWPENGLKVKWKCKTISGSNEYNFGQTEIIFRKFYFP